MSTWDLDIGDASEEIHALRNKLSSKGGFNLSYFLSVAHTTLEDQIAAQQDHLVRQAAEIQELNNALNETIYKV